MISPKEMSKAVYSLADKAPELLLLGTLCTRKYMDDDGTIYEITYVDVDGVMHITKQQKVGKCFTDHGLGSVVGVGLNERMSHREWKSSFNDWLV